MIGNKYARNMQRLTDEVNLRYIAHLVGFHYKEYQDERSAKQKYITETF
jgi:hypothetical protein